jgi:putative toxin-antitoxin system antitoxin component (TIGR02293 family)
MRQTLARKHVARASQQTHEARYASQGASLGLSAARAADLIDRVRRGLSFKALQSLSMESGIAIPEIAQVLEIPERTLARRKARGKFAPDESERLLRLSTVFEKAVELFAGDIAAAVAWLRSPKAALGHASPLDYTRSELGAREVEDLIGRLEHGVFA